MSVASTTAAATAVSTTTASAVAGGAAVRAAVTTMAAGRRTVVRRGARAAVAPASATTAAVVDVTNLHATLSGQHVEEASDYRDHRNDEDRKLSRLLHVHQNLHRFVGLDSIAHTPLQRPEADEQVGPNGDLRTEGVRSERVPGSFQTTPRGEGPPEQSFSAGVKFYSAFRFVISNQICHRSFEETGR